VIVYLIVNDMSGRTEMAACSRESDARRYARDIFSPDEMDFVAVVPVVVSGPEVTT